MARRASPNLATLPPGTGHPLPGILPLGNPTTIRHPHQASYHWVHSLGTLVVGILIRHCVPLLNMDILAPGTHTRH